jgi:hypothetical protein
VPLNPTGVIFSSHFLRCSLCDITFLNPFIILKPTGSKPTGDSTNPVGGTLDFALEEAKENETAALLPVCSRATYSHAEDRKRRWTDDEEANASILN